MLAYLDRKEKGFTLMELLIAVAIVAVLAGVGIPVYLGLQNRAKASEATANLDGIGLSQEAYKLTNDTYIDCLASPRDPDALTAAGQTAIAWNDLGTGFTAIGFDTNKPVRFSYAVKADATNPHLEYDAGAIGDADGDFVTATTTGRVLYLSSEATGPRVVTGADGAIVTALNVATAFGAALTDAPAVTDISD